MTLLILVVVMAVALVVETLYFNIKQVRRLNRDIKIRDEFIDHIFIKARRSEDKTEDIEGRIKSIIKSHNDLVDVVFDEVIPNVNELIDKTTIKKQTKEKVLKKVAKKRGRPRKNK